MSSILNAFLIFCSSPAGAALLAAIPTLYQDVAKILVQDGHITPQEIASHLVSVAPGIAPIPKENPS